MDNSKSIWVFIGMIFVVAVFFQVSRTNLLFYFITNDNGSQINTELISDNTTYKNKEENNEKYLIVYDKNDEESVKLNLNVNRTLKYMKKNSVTTNTISEDMNLKIYKSVLIALSDLNRIKDLDKLIDYVESGGRVVFCQYLETDNSFFRIYRKIGINEMGQYKKTHGITLHKNILIKGLGVEIKSPTVSNYVLASRISNDSVLYASSVDDIPLIWEKDYGKGKFLVFNGTMLFDKKNRGVLVGGLSCVNEDYIYPIMNLKILHIDDFPAPIPQGINEDVYNEYGKNNDEFFRDVWWPDMVESQNRYNIKYTGLLIETYSDNVKPPFKDKNSENTQNLKIYGMELISGGGELGLHGFNHQSLALDGYIKRDLGYNPWEKKEHMIMSLQEAVSFINSVFPKYKIFSYVAPSNILSKEGREILKLGIPDLKVVSGLYMYSETEAEYIQEFEVAKDGIVELPRTTAGYKYNDETIWYSFNTVTSLGIFSHFVHPDDLFDEERNGGKKWSGLKKEYDDLLKRINDDFPWIRPTTSTESAEIIKDYDKSKLFISKENNVFKGEYTGSVKNINFILKTNKKIKGKKKCNVKEIDTGWFFVEILDNRFEINLDGDDL